MSTATSFRQRISSLSSLMRSSRKWFSPRTITVALLLGLAAYAVMALANLWPLYRKCDWQFLTIFSCLLGARENLAGGVIGAAGALMAAWLAWVAIQKQIAAQQRANLIADLTFWQRKYDSAKIAMQGLEQVDDITKRCFTIFGGAPDYLEALRMIERAGLLVEQSLPVTGSNLIAFRMAQLLERLRHQHRILADRRTSLTVEQALKEIESDMHDLAEKIPSAVDATNHELTEATRVLVDLKQSSDYPKS
jgi:hypothetical protein